MDIEMELICCANCGMAFAMTKDKAGRLRQSHNTFYCPSGHPQSFTAKTDAERVEERLRARVSELEAAEQKRAADSAKAARLARQKKANSKKVAPAKSG